MFLISLLVLLSLQLTSCDPNHHAIRRIKDVEIRGYKSESRSGKIYSGFRGIQYAEVKTRFQSAEPINSLHKNTKFLDYGSDCPQINIRNGRISTEEQCLFLNVYVPDGGEEKKAVIVYIHGGAWVHGSARDAEEKYFMDEDVVLVTLNYRLGAFGLLAMQNLRATGNHAFTDQVVALQWVQKNIGHFGGDKDSVTIMGESAGAGSVALLTFSSKASGLFHRAIGQSGAILNPWAWRPIEESESVAFELGHKLGCNETNSDLLLDCLLKKDALDILQAQKSLAKFYVDPMVPFMPVVDSNNPDAFLKQSPLKAIADGNFNKVPAMLTVCKDEGLLLHSASIVKNEDLLEQLNKNWVRNGGVQAFLDQDARLPAITIDQKEKIMTEVRKFYFEDKNLKPNDPWTLEKLTEFYSDRHFLHGVRDTALLMAKHTPIYTGIFTRNGERSIIQLFGYEKPIGVSHADELQFFFNSVFPDQDSFSPDFQHYSAMLVKLWTNFARTGIPSVQIEDEEIIWNRVTPDEINSRKLNWVNLENINETLTNPFEQRLSFWDKIYYIYQKQQRNEL